MPRINIEDQFWIDIGDVAAKIGDHQRAVGMALIFFRLAQERFKDGKVMSEQEFFAEGFSEALIPKFAIRTERGIEAKGGAKHFKWLADSNDFMKSIGKKGGLISSMRPRDEKGHFLPHPDDDVQASKRSPSVTQAAWTETSTNVQASKPSSSSSSSSSEELNTVGVRHKKTPRIAPVKPHSVEHLFEIVGQEFLDELSQTYPDESFLKQETRKLFMYYRNHPPKNNKTPKGWRQAIMNWMAKGWDSKAHKQGSLHV